MGCGEWPVQSRDHSATAAAVRWSSAFRLDCEPVTVEPPCGHSGNGPRNQTAGCPCDSRNHWLGGLAQPTVRSTGAPGQPIDPTIWCATYSAGWVLSLLRQRGGPPRSTIISDVGNGIVPAKDKPNRASVIQLDKFSADFRANSFSLPVPVAGNSLLAVRPTTGKHDDRMPAELGDEPSPLFATLGRRN